MQTNQSQYYKADFDAMTARFSGLGITNAGGAFSRALRIPDFREFFGEFSGAIGRTLRIESTRGGVVPAMALKRFQLKHGKLPGALNELPPEFFPAVPIDP